jgi:hypothetical protein
VDVEEEEERERERSVRAHRIAQICEEEGRECAEWRKRSGAYFEEQAGRPLEHHEGPHCATVEGAVR